MATAEGVFPKVGNDPLYASEVNRFAGFRFIEIGSTGIVVSGTADRELGSILISPGNLTSPTQIEGLLRFNFPGTESAAVMASSRAKVIISGLSANATITIGGGPTTDIGKMITFKSIIGSPFLGGMYATAERIAGGPDTNIEVTGSEANHIDTTGSIVIFLNATATGSVEFSSFSFHSLGPGL